LNKILIKLAKILSNNDTVLIIEMIIEFITLNAQRQVKKVNCGIIINKIIFLFLFRLIQGLKYVTNLWHHMYSHELFKLMQCYNQALIILLYRNKITLVINIL